MYVKYSNYQAPQKCTHWQINCKSPTLPLICKEVSLIFRHMEFVRSLPPGQVRAIWKSGYKKAKASVHLTLLGKHKLVNIRWLSLLSPGHIGAVGRVSGQCSLAFAYVVQHIVVLHHFINSLNDIQCSSDSFLVAPLEEDIVLETTALDLIKWTWKQILQCN